MIKIPLAILILASILHGAEETNTTSLPSGTWDVNAIYTGGEIVESNTKTYQAKWWTQGNEPGTEEWGPWEEVAGSVTTPNNDENTTTETK